MASLAIAATASARSSMPTMLQDDKVLVGGDQAQRDARLDEIKSLGVDIVKVRVSWRGIAPNATSRAKPSFNASDPAAYPAGGWAPYDAIVQGATSRGMSVYFQLGGDAPEWATPGKRKSAVTAPNAAEFRQFVQAVGARYPTVHTFSVWNEPNLRSWLDPQTRKGVPVAPAIYRRLAYAASDGLKASGHASDQLLIGELLPFARSGRTGSTKLRPIAFLREMACLNRHYRPYRGKAAKRRGCNGKFRKLPGTGLAFHPYTLGGGPNIKTPNRDDASISTLSRVTRALDKIYSKRRLAKRRMPLWITEFGFQSSPPDHFATPLSRIPGFQAQSERIAFKNRRVVSFSQYPLLDDRGLAGFQSGLRFSNGKAKKGVYSGFARTIYPVKSGSRVEVFGCDRAAASGTAITIQGRTGKKGKWKNVGSAKTNSYGYFDVRVRFSPGRKSQLRYVAGSAKSRAAGVAKR